VKRKKVDEANKAAPSVSQPEQHSMEDSGDAQLADAGALADSGPTAEALPTCSGGTAAVAADVVAASGSNQESDSLSKQARISKMKVAALVGSADCYSGPAIAASHNVSESVPTGDVNAAADAAGAAACSSGQAAAAQNVWPGSAESGTARCKGASIASFSLCSFHACLHDPL
jgi:hypothetical protein